MISADDATRLAAVGAICSAIATIWLAWVTRSLAKGTKSLVEATRLEGVQNAEANQRSYDLALHQIDLQSKTDVYEDTLAYMYDDFLVIQELATSLGLTFLPKAYGLRISTDEKALTTNQLYNRLSLNASPAILEEFSIWLLQVSALYRDLVSPAVRDTEGNIQPIQDPDYLTMVNNHFKEAFDLLKIRHLSFVDKFRGDLHPQETEVNKLKQSLHYLPD